MLLHEMHNELKHEQVWQNSLINIRNECMCARNEIFQKMKQIGIHPPAAFIDENEVQTLNKAPNEDNMIEIAKEYMRMRLTLCFFHELIDIEKPECNPSKINGIRKETEDIKRRIHNWAAGMGFPMETIQNNIDAEQMFNETWEAIMLKLNVKM